MTDSRTREKVRLAYSKDSDAYDRHRLESTRGKILSQHDLRLVRGMWPSIPTGTKVLEIGAGTGRFTIPLLKDGHEVVATDINEEMLRGLKEKLNQATFAERCTVQVEDAFSLSFADEKFGMVMLFHVIPRMLSESDQEAALKEIGRVVASGGYLFFNFRNSRSPYCCLSGGHTISAHRITGILGENGFSILEMKGKHLITRKLLDVLPTSVGRVTASLDASLWSVLPLRAWDVFVLAKKT